MFSWSHIFFPCIIFLLKLREKNMGWRSWVEGEEKYHTLEGSYAVSGPEWSQPHFCCLRPCRAQTKLKDNSEESMASRSQGGNLGRGLEKCKQHGIMRELPQVFSSRLLTFGPHGDDSWTPHPQIRCFQAADCSRFSRRVSKVDVFQSSCSDLGSTVCHAANRLISGQEPEWTDCSAVVFLATIASQCCTVDTGITSCCGFILCGEEGMAVSLVSSH